MNLTEEQLCAALLEYAAQIEEQMGKAAMVLLADETPVANGSVFTGTISASTSRFNSRMIESGIHAMAEVCLKMTQDQNCECEVCEDVIRRMAAIMAIIDPPPPKEQQS